MNSKRFPDQVGDKPFVDPSTNRRALNWQGDCKRPGSAISECPLPSSKSKEFNQLDPREASESDVTIARTAALVAATLASAILEGLKHVEEPYDPPSHSH